MFPETPKTLLKKIAELAQGDDHAEWAAFVELYTPPLTRFVRLQSPTLSAADVEDVVQDVFVRLVAVLRAGKIDRTKAKFRAYLASMTRRILIDRYRAAQARPQLVLGTDPSQVRPQLVLGTDPSQVRPQLVLGTDPSQVRPSQVRPQLVLGTDPSQVVLGTVPALSSPRMPGDLAAKRHLGPKGHLGAQPHLPSPVEVLDPGTAVDILWRMAAREAAREHVLTKTAISAQSRRIYEMLEGGQSPREVARAMGVSYASVTQVKSRIDRAIVAVEKRMERG